MLEERHPGAGGYGESPPREIAVDAAPEAAPDGVLPAIAQPGIAQPGKLLPPRVPLARAAGGFTVWRDPATWAIAACVFGAYLVISLYRLLQLSPSSWDLGIFT